MRYVTETVEIRGQVLGAMWDGSPGSQELAFRTGRFRTGRKPGDKLARIVSDAFAKGAEDFANALIDADSLLIITRRSVLTGATRTRTFPLAHFPSVAYLLDLPDDTSEADDENVWSLA